LFGLWNPKYIENNYALIGDATNKIIQNNNDYEAYDLRAKSKEELKDYYGAIADYEKSFEITPLVESDDYFREMSYRNMLELKNKTQQYDDAMSGYTKLFEIKNDYSVLGERGKVKSILKDYEGAINDYNQAINVDPNSTSVLLCYKYRGDAKTTLNDYKGAISDYAKAISIIKNDIPTDEDDYTYDFLLDSFYLNCGISYYNNKNFLEAINDYNSVLGMRIDKTTALRTFEIRALAKLELDDISGACKDFNIVKNLLKEDGDDYSNIQKLIDSNCSQ
jgi:tetratricopeptide (TPR) repeat protein